MPRIAEIGSIECLVNIIALHQSGADLEIFDRGGPIDYPIGIYQNLGRTKIVAN